MLHQRMDPHPHRGREHMSTLQIGHGHIEVGSTRTSYREGCFVVFFPFWMPSAPERAKKQLNAIGVVLELFRTSNAQLLFRIFLPFKRSMWVGFGKIKSMTQVLCPSGFLGSVLH